MLRELWKCSIIFVFKEPRCHTATPILYSIRLGEKTSSSNSKAVRTSEISLSSNSKDKRKCQGRGQSEEVRGTTGGERVNASVDDWE